MNNIPVALQLFSLRDECAKNFKVTLETVKNMGYDGVEFAGYHGFKAEEIREMLDDLGLVVAGTHVMLEDLLGDALQSTIRFNKILENKFIIVARLPDEMKSTKNDWLSTAQLMNDIAKKLDREGMWVGYHNHVAEFQLIDGEVPWIIFFDETVSDVIMQLDVGNAMLGGVSSGEIFSIIERYPGRATSVHLKEYSSKNELALVGEGEVPWKKYLSLCKNVGKTEWYVIEQEKYPFSPIKSVEQCLTNLKEIMK
jgi:sugar phosphate isomerase/epimerase